MEFDGCLLCGQIALENVCTPVELYTVTSDCKPWTQAGEFAVCASCGHVQKRLTKEWFAGINAIYNQYEMYPLSDGNEQVVFKNATPVPRTLRLLERIEEAVQILETGKLLDIGCGNGAFLRTFGQKYKDWDLFGYEQSDTNSNVIRNIRGVKDFYSGSLDQIEDRFDIISMLYVIEHLHNPVAAMQTVRNLLKPEGIFFVQTSDFTENPFDLVVFDHCSHFHFNSLKYVVESAGLETKIKADDWVAKEIGLVAATMKNSSAKSTPINNTQWTAITEKALDWLHKVVVHARSVSINSIFGMFGTALAGTWLTKSLEDRVSFFVDEDPLKQGKTHMGLPILHPADVKNGETVYLAFPHKLANELYRRLAIKYVSTRFIVPPNL